MTIKVAINGFGRAFPTHTAVAAQVRQGLADCGIGLLAAARQAGLDFVPLFEERFDLVVPQENVSLPTVQVLLDRVVSADFQRHAASLGGYETSQSGTVRLDSSASTQN